MTADARPVGGLERVWLAAGRIHAPFAIQIVLQPAAMPSPARWEAAWAATIAAHPGLRARWVGRGRAARWVFDGPAPPLRALPAWDAAAPVAWLDDPLDPARGAPVELVLAGPTAVLRAHHAVTDGRGLWAMAEDLLRALDGRPLVGAAGGPDDATWTAGVTAAPVAAPPPDRPAPMGEAGDGTPGMTWRLRRWPAGPDVTARLLAALSAAADRPLRVGVPVDLRRYRPDTRSDAHLTGVVHLDVPAGATAAACRSALADALAAHEAVAHARAAGDLRGVPVALMRLIGARGARKSLKSGRFPVSATLSNLGRRPLALEGAPCPAFWIPPGNPGMPLFLGVVGDATHLAVCAVAPAALAAGLDALLDRMAACLGDAGGT